MGQPALPVLPRQQASPSEPSSAPGAGPSLGDAPREGEERDELSAPHPASPAEGGDVPDGERPATSKQRLTIQIEGPHSVALGSDAAFKVTVHNTSPEAVDDVVVICTLPDGLVYPGSERRAFQSKLYRVEHHEKREVNLVLRCEQDGRHCVEFQVRGKGVETIVESACVECGESSVQLDINGPTERMAGGRAEYVITFGNPTGRELPDVHVILEHEGVLEPREASTGVIRKPGRLEWDLGLVRIDERIQIQAEFACDSATERTCLAARVVGRDLKSREAAACLRVVPQREIELDIADDQDPVDIGEKVLYRVRVTNRGLHPVDDLVVNFQSSTMQPLGVTIDDIDVLASAEFDPETGMLEVPLPGALAVDETRTFVLHTTAIRSGAGEFRATVSQHSGALEVSVAESTVVNPVSNSVAVQSP